MLNLWALRGTDPRELRDHPDPVGPGWAEAFDEAVRDVGFVVGAWGTAPLSAGTRVARRCIGQVVGHLAELGLEVRCVGQTAHEAQHRPHPPTPTRPRPDHARTRPSNLRQFPRVKLLLDGQNHHDLTLQQVSQLADTLACELHDLLAHDAEADTDADTATPLTATLGALLHHADRAVPATALATATGTPLDDIAPALEHLDRQLRLVGLRVRTDTNDGAVSITHDPSATTDDQTTAVTRAVQARLQLDEGTSELIYRTLTDAPNAKSVQASNDGRVLLGRLINAGIIEEADAPLALTADVRESLLLDAR